MYSWTGSFVYLSVSIGNTRDWEPRRPSFRSCRKSAEVKEMNRCSERCILDVGDWFPNSCLFSIFYGFFHGTRNFKHIRNTMIIDEREVKKWLFLFLSYLFWVLPHLNHPTQKTRQNRKFRIEFLHYHGAFFNFRSYEWIRNSKIFLIICSKLMAE